MQKYVGLRFKREDDKGIYTVWFLGSSERLMREDLASREEWKDFIKRPDVESEVLSEDQIRKETSYAFEAAAKNFRGGAQWTGDRTFSKIKVKQ